MPISLLNIKHYCGLTPKVQESVEELGWGGISLVTKIRRSLGHYEILKEPLPKFYGDRTMEGQFLREFAILKELSHPGIIKAYRLDYRKISDTLQIPSIVLEEIEGCALSDLRDFLTRLSSEDFRCWLIHFLGQVSSIFRYLKDRVVHGDLAPDNIMITSKGWVKLIDFGTAVHAEDCLNFKIAGRPFFRSPAVLKTGRANFEDDIFAIARVLRWLLHLREDDNHIQEFEALADELENSRDLSLLAESYQPVSYPAENVRKRATMETTEVRLSAWNRWSPVFAKVAVFVGILVSMTSFMPQHATIDIDSYPFALFTVESHPGKTFETPQRGLKVPAGKQILHFQDTKSGGKMLRREILVLPLERTRVFEDFGKR